MTPIEAAALVAALALPLHWLVLRQIDKLSDPAYLRKQGVVIVMERALQAHSEPIGEYMGARIWGTVTFMGMVYRFDRIAPRRYRHRIRARELYLDPGLIYVTD